jgi:hypothetical protein
VLCACAGLIPAPGAGHVRWARSHGYPDDLAGLQEGRRLFVQKCDGCHALPRPKEYEPREWPAWMDSMRVVFREEGFDFPPRQDSLIRNYLAVASGHWRDSQAARKTGNP